jgi:DNA integrity scanning protein DisA with diadenylate cyclase activity
MLSEIEKTTVKLILGLLTTSNDPIVSGTETAEIRQVDDLLADLDEARETLMKEAIEQYNQVKYSTGRLRGDFNQDPADTRFRIREEVVRILGYRPTTSPYSLDIGRG